MRSRILWFAAAAALAAVPKLPPPFATPSADNPPRVVAPPRGAHLAVPGGFRVDTWASGFERPRYMLLGPRGEVLLADSGDAGSGAVYAFPGADPHHRIRLISGLDRPSGLAMLGKWLYVAEPGSVKRYEYDATHTKAGPGQEVISLRGLENGHWTRPLLFDSEGRKLYVAIGSAGNVETGDDPRRAAINRYNPDGTGHEIFASGLRNPDGIHWYPGTNTLWAAVQERDLMGNNLPPDYLTHVQPGAFYGWPYAYIGPHPDPRIGPQRPDLVRKTVVPDLLLGAHVAAMDFAFYTGGNFPSDYRGGAFVAEHGSWNRSPRVGYRVVYVEFQNGHPSGTPKDFLTGWMVSPNSKDVWGRPVGVLELKDGTLLISDDGGNKIWRVSYSAPPTASRRK
jgi:glucose/arabinose dehydrogenase